MQASLRFNAYSELDFTVGRTYLDLMTGQTNVHPFYDKIEALRLVYLEGFGYFELQDPEIVSDGIMEVKNISANSLEYNLSQKYIEELYINTGKRDSVEVMYAIDKNSDGMIDAEEIVPVSLYNPNNKQLSLLHLILEKAYGWSIGHVDTELQTMTRTFEVSRTSIYDFITQDICESFNCFVIFDTIENKINFYAESAITKHYGDGSRKVFNIPSKYKKLSTVSVNGYKTTAYSYDHTTGTLIFDSAPPNQALIEITDGSQENWITDVYITFDNLAQEVNVSYSADDIKTVLSVKGADDLHIREVNMGLPYITDLSYYYTPDWMGQDLYDAYKVFLDKCDQKRPEYLKNAQSLIEKERQIAYEDSRMSTKYDKEYVDENTVGKYYVRGGDYPNYYYTEVQLPVEYTAGVTYYSLSGVGINAQKVANFEAALKDYYEDNSVDAIRELKDEFEFVENNAIEKLATQLLSTKRNDKAVVLFLNKMWNELGLYSLEVYLNEYKGDKALLEEAGHNATSHIEYWSYYVVSLICQTLQNEMKNRGITVAQYQQEYTALQSSNAKITEELSLNNNFTHKQLIRLSSFWREDEYSDSNFIITDSDTTATIMQTKQELLECGRIELSKLCEPRLEFSMNMANIYALPEFSPIVDQFQLGNLINVAIRDDYIKRARLLEVNINFDDFSDFSCEFGELTNLRSPSSIHADLLSQALSAGKSVASNASYWNKGADLATSTDIKIQQGLLNAVEGLYTADQSVVIDNEGIRLRKIIDVASDTYSPNQAWLKNNTILYSTDGFKTAKTGLGEFEVDGKTFYGMIAEAVLSGYIESSTMVGGTINIGDGAFMVDEHGNVTMGGNSQIGGMTAQDIQNYMGNDSNIVYTTCPINGNYLAREIWVVGENDYVQTDDNGNIVDSTGNIIAPISMGTVSDDRRSVLDVDGNVIGAIENNLVVDANDSIIGIYNSGRNIASSVIGFIKNGIAVDFNETKIGSINRRVVTNEGNLVGLVSDNYIISAEIIGTTSVNIVEAGSILRSINDGDGFYVSSDWISALKKYDLQHSDLNDRVGSIQGDLDQHFEFSNDNGLVIKDGNSTIYTRLRNDRLSFMQHDEDPLVGDAEVAYISDKKLYISNAEITGLDAEDGNLEVNGPATVKKLMVENQKANNSLVIRAEDNGSFSILIQTQGS